MLGTDVEDIAQFLHQEERLDSVSWGMAQHVALWACTSSLTGSERELELCFGPLLLVWGTVSESKVALYY